MTNAIHAQARDPEGPVRHSPGAPVSVASRVTPEGCWSPGPGALLPVTHQRAQRLGRPGGIELEDRSARSPRHHEQWMLDGVRRQLVQRPDVMADRPLDDPALLYPGRAQMPLEQILRRPRYPHRDPNTFRHGLRANLHALSAVVNRRSRPRDPAAKPVASDAATELDGGTSRRRTRSTRRYRYVTY